MYQMILNLLDILSKLSLILTRKQKKIAVAVFFMSILGALLETIGVSVMLPFVQIIIDPYSIVNNNIVKNVLSGFDILSIDEIQLMVVAALIVFFIYLIKNIYMVLLSYTRTKFAAMIKRDVSVYMMNADLHQGYPFFLSSNVAELQRGVSGDVNGVYTIISMLYKFSSEALTMLSICIFVLVTDYKIAIITVGIAAVCILMATIITKKYIKELAIRFRKYDTVTRKYSYRIFEGIKEIMVMNKQDFFIEEFRNANQRQLSASVKQEVAAESPSYIYEFVCVSALLIAICFRSLSVTDKTQFIANMAAVVVAVFRIMPSMGRITNYLNNIMFNLPSLNATCENIKNANDYMASLQETKESSETELEFNREIKIENISWKYSDESPWIIRNLNLTIKKGESVALIGKSGAGKSTLSDIILGLLKPQYGRVLVDEKNIENSPSGWNKLVGYVPQSVYLLDDTIRRNVAFGLPDNEINDDLVWSALKQADLFDYVKKLPNGLETILGERGVRFSGGQRQRIAIARVMYYNPEILIFDEATSALDNKTEEVVMQSIDALMRKKTLIIIAHRLSTIAQCDNIYEITDGIAVKRDKKEQQSKRI